MGCATVGLLATTLTQVIAAGYSSFTVTMPDRCCVAGDIIAFNLRRVSDTPSGTTVFFQPVTDLPNVSVALVMRVEKPFDCNKCIWELNITEKTQEREGRTPELDNEPVMASSRRWQEAAKRLSKLSKSRQQQPREWHYRQSFDVAWLKEFIEGQLGLVNTDLCKHINNTNLKPGNGDWKLWGRKGGL